MSKPSTETFPTMHEELKDSLSLEDYLDTIHGHGFSDDSCGSVTENGAWYGKFLLDAADHENLISLNLLDEGETPYGALLQEDSQGFKTAWYVNTEAGMEAEWSEIQAEVYGGEEDEEDGEEGLSAMEDAFAEGPYGD